MYSISKSGLFDPEWYLVTYPDVAGSPRGALLHFVCHGAKEGRRPNPLFDTNYYVSSNPDVASTGVNPLLHYILSGASEGRFPNPHFDGNWYLNRYPDVVAAKKNPLSHYLRIGAAGGRLPSRGFSPDAYRYLNPGIPAERAFQHFVLQNSTAAPLRKFAQPRAPGAATHFTYQPLVSIIVPVYNVTAEWLLRAVSSVQAQTYPNWELCICDDGSTAADTIRAVRDLEGKEPRLRVKRLQENGGISKATNEAIALATGEFVAFLDNDDELLPHSLEAYVAALNADPSIDVIYSDEDKLSERGIPEEPFLKPDWSPSMLREVMYVGHLLSVRRALIEQIGGCDSRYDGVQDYEMMLRLSEHTSAIHHVPEVLYHWRRIPGSIADRPDSKPDIGRKQVAAINAHLVRAGISASAKAHPILAHRAILVPNVRERFPRISIIILTKDAPELISRCLATIFERSSYPNFEVVVVDNGSSDVDALAVLDRYPLIRVPYLEPFNFSRANNLGVAASTGDVLVLLNNDTEILDGDWLEQMLFFLDDENVGAIGPLLLYPDRSVQHAGVALGIRGTADHVLRGLPEDSDGYFGSLSCTREVSAVTFACVMLRKSDYDAVEGLCELYQTHYQDVDMCLRLRAIGRRNIYTPRTRLIHHESATRGSAYDNIDRALLLDCWGSEIRAGDPYSRWEPESNAAA
ncbi:glycosyltransferase family 2 protein [Rhizobium sp. RAF56]|uniref:glycosyltransferase family 2 protein n=1 Tax=Rhizobium sp. RAF56 TaxID=3233062 RepID=UPI003F971FD5